MCQNTLLQAYLDLPVIYVQVLAKHRILSAPLVMSPSLEDLDSGGLDEGSTAPALLGWCDVNDILRALLQRKDYQYGTHSKPVVRHCKHFVHCAWKFGCSEWIIRRHAAY